MTTPIDVSHLSKRYDTVAALSDVSFAVQSGEIMGFLGPNGAGKTTTLRILTGMLASSEGQVRIEGLDVATHGVEIRRRIGYLPEQVALYPEMRIREYLAYRAAIKGVPPRARRARVDAVLAQCDMLDVQRKLIGRLSKGYRQRVGLADCLIAQPKILILDEPTVGLDPHQIRQTRALITELGRHATILLSTHILPEVEMLCHRVTIINKGRIVATDTPAQLRQRLQGQQTLRVELQGEPGSMTPALNQLPGVARVVERGRTNGSSSFEVELKPGADAREAIFRLAVERRWVLRELSAQRASLEDVFIHLTTHEQTE
jgi:ABC-2 type transport system ATP-binding protein